VAQSRTIKELFLAAAKANEFDVATGNFGDLEVRAAEGFHYFYDSTENSLVKSFVLREGPRVDTMCDVILAGNEDAFTPPVCGCGRRTRPTASRPMRLLSRSRVRPLFS